MRSRPWAILMFTAGWLSSATAGLAGDTREGLLPPLAASHATRPATFVGVNYNGGGPLEPEFGEHIYRSAAPGNWPVPAISGDDLASGLKPVVVSGRLHGMSGPPEKLTDGAGATSEDDPPSSCFFDNGVLAGRLRITLKQPKSIGQINLYAWHRNGLAGGCRAPLKLNVYASDGLARGFDLNDPHGPGYVLLARVNTVRPGGVNVQTGQHGASIVAAQGGSLGRYSHFLFELLPPVDGGSHTFLNEIDIVRAVAAVPAPPSTAAANHFDQVVGPLLARRCLECHNPTDKKGGLDLSRAESAAAGGESGAAFVPGKPDDSFLLDRVMGDEMPPKHPLSAVEKDLLRGWIASGATWGSQPIDRFRFSSEARAGYDWWSLQPLSQPPLPKVKYHAWPAGPIDRFILAKLESQQLSPAPAADRRTLIRRVMFDLVGLPPSPDEVDAFVRDDRPDAYARLVDRLLDSSQYGERWARHWLDIVRFSESQGFERNKFYPAAWKYRDWVIEALNDDMPYDEFVRLQLAGDVLRPNDPRGLVAAEYLVFAPHDLLGLTQGSDAMKASTREDELENLVGNIGQTFLGLTINCARCHDHKFDPLRQSEYFQMAAAVGGIQRADRHLPAGLRRSDSSVPEGSQRGNGQVRDRQATAPDLATALEKLEKRLALALGESGGQLVSKAHAAGLDDARQNLATTKNALAQAEKNLAAVEAQVGKPGAPSDILVAVANNKQFVGDWHRALDSIQEELDFANRPYSTRGFDRLLEKLDPKRRLACAPILAALSRLEMRARLASGGAAHGFVSAPPQYFRVLGRGSFRSPGSVVGPGGFRCIAGADADWKLSPAAPESQRRLRLAEWITDPGNPLLARVIVNRLWHYHFGVGLVETPNDFGYSGGRPSHPELLDALASELVRHGWSLKHIQRQIVLSATYRQSAELNPRAAKIDSGNRLLWRKAPLRLEAEALRDAVLAVSGELNPRMGGPSFHDIDIGVSGDNVLYTPSDRFDATVNRRSVYRTVVRSSTPPLLDTLDCADPTVATPRRNVTTTPLQALSLLNNPFMARSASAFADRLRREAGERAEQQIDRAYQLAFGRAATDRERQTALEFVANYGLADLCLMLFNSNEFLQVD